MKKIYLFVLGTLILNFSRAQIISTVAGDGNSAYTGDGGQAVAASIWAPTATAVDKYGNLYIAQAGNNVIRKVNVAGVISTFAGNGLQGFSGDGGQAIAASFNNIRAIAIDTAGNIYVDDTGNYRVRRINIGGTVTTVAGNGISAYSGDGGLATSASFQWTQSIAIDKNNCLYIADEINNVVRKVDMNGIISTFVGNGTAGYSGDGGIASTAQLKGPDGICFDKFNNLFIADANNNVIRKVSSIGVISTFAGSTQGFSGDGGQAVSAQLNIPIAVACDSLNNVYISDRYNNKIRVVTPNGIINTIAGDGIAGFSGDGGPALNAEFKNVVSIYVSPANEIYLSDFQNNRIRKIGALNSVSYPDQPLSLNIYPLPVSNSLNIESQNANIFFQLKITDVLGKDMRIETLELRQGKTSIDVSTFQNGIYFLTVTSGKESSTQKLIINH
jgi:hypothetical protein